MIMEISISINAISLLFSLYTLWLLWSSPARSTSTCKKCTRSTSAAAHGSPSVVTAEAELVNSKNKSQDITNAKASSYAYLTSTRDHLCGAYADRNTDQRKNYLYAGIQIYNSLLQIVAICAVATALSTSTRSSLVAIMFILSHFRKLLFIQSDVMMLHLVLPSLSQSVIRGISYFAVFLYIILCTLDTGLQLVKAVWAERSYDQLVSVSKVLIIVWEVIIFTYDNIQNMFLAYTLRRSNRSSRVLSMIMIGIFLDIVFLAISVYTYAYDLQEARVPMLASQTGILGLRATLVSHVYRALVVQSN